MSKRGDGAVTRAARLLEVLRDSGATVPSDISPGAVGDSIVSMMQDLIGEPEWTSLSTGRIRVSPDWDEGRVVGFDIAVEV